MRSGWIALTSTAGTFRSGSHAGYWWASRGASARYDGAAVPSAYNLLFYVTDVYSSNGPDERWRSYPLRCLSTVLGM